MNHEEDLLCIDKVINGDSLSYTHLVDKYKLMAYTLALRIVKNEEDAQEVSQDAFLKAFRSLAKFKKQSSFSSWLYRIVYNTALSRLRKKHVETIPLDFKNENISIDETNQSFRKLVKEDQKKFLNDALNQLPEEDVVLINLFYLLEKNAEEIATIVGLSHANVRVKLLRSRKKLHVILSGLLKKEMREIL